MSLVLLFVDGLGVGKENPEINPCIQSDSLLSNYFSGDGLHHTDGMHCVPLDAGLDVPGLPQSATGQTALLSGVNASKRLGRHLPGFPNSLLRDLLVEKGLLGVLKSSGLRTGFANAYRPEFFRLPEKVQWRLSVTTVSCLAAGIPLKTIDDIVRQEAIYHDFTNQALIEKGFDLPRMSPEEAGRQLARIAGSYDFLLYEYFLTDRAGHGQNAVRARNEIDRLNRFITAFLSVSARSHDLIITSDHGNIEDLSVKTHTRNPAMTLIAGPESDNLIQGLASITDISPAVIRYFGVRHD